MSPSHTPAAPAMNRMGQASADRAFHLQREQAIQLDRVLHRQLFGEGLEEAVDDHRLGLGFGQPAALQIEQLLVGDLAHRRLVADVDALLVDLDRRVGVAAALLVEQQRVAAHERLGVLGALGHLEQPAIGGAGRRPC